MKMNVYKVYLDDGEMVYRTVVPAESEEAALTYVRGNGEVIAVKEATDSYRIDAEKVAFAMEKYGFNPEEADIVFRLIYMTGLDKR